MRATFNASVMALILVTGACAPAPTAPTATQQSPSRPPARTYTINFQFDPVFWKQLIYDEFDQTTGVRARLSQVSMATENCTLFGVRPLKWTLWAGSIDRRWGIRRKTHGPTPQLQH